MIVGAFGDHFRALTCLWCFPVPSFLTAGFAPCDPDQSVICFAELDWPGEAAGAGWVDRQLWAHTSQAHDAGDRTAVSARLHLPAAQRGGSLHLRMCYLAFKTLQNYCLYSDLALHVLRGHINHKKTAIYGIKLHDDVGKYPQVTHYITLLLRTNTVYYPLYYTYNLLYYIRLVLYVGMWRWGWWHEAIGCKVSRCHCHSLQNLVHQSSMCPLSARGLTLLFSLPPFLLSCSIPHLLIIPSSLWQSYGVYIGWCCQVILTDNPPRPRYRYSWKKNDEEEAQKGGWVASFKSDLWGPFMKLWECPPAWWWFSFEMSFRWWIGVSFWLEKQNIWQIYNVRPFPSVVEVWKNVQ